MKWGHWKAQDKFSFLLHCTWQITLGGVTFTQKLSSTPLSQTQLNKNAPRIALIHDLTTTTVPFLAFLPHNPPLHYSFQSNMTLLTQPCSSLGSQEDA